MDWTFLVTIDFGQPLQHHWTSHWQRPCCICKLPSSLVSRSCHKPVLFRTRFLILCHQRFNWNKNLNQLQNLTWKNPLSFISVAFEGDRVRASASSLNTQVSLSPASSPASFSSSSLTGRNRDVVGALVLLPFSLLQLFQLCHQPIYLFLLRLQLLLLPIYFLLLPVQLPFLPLEFVLLLLNEQQQFASWPHCFVDICSGPHVWYPCFAWGAWACNVPRDPLNRTITFNIGA